MAASSIDRRRFLTAAALTAGAAPLPGGLLSGRAVAAVPPQITLPERGIHDTSPASSWTDGFLTGNGEYGAVLYGAPALEKVVFNYHRLVLPNGTRDVTPPVISGRLEGARDKALAGDYAGASRDFAAGWSLRSTQAYHPARQPELHHACHHHRRLRLPESARHLPLGADAFGYEGVTRVVASGSGATVTVNGSTIVVAKAAKVLLTKLGRYESSTGWDSQPQHTQLAALGTDYAALLSRHTALHTPVYDRSGLDLNVPAADRQLSVSELITRQNADRTVIDPALLERTGCPVHPVAGRQQRQPALEGGRRRRWICPARQRPQRLVRGRGGRIGGQRRQGDPEACR